MTSRMRLTTTHTLDGIGSDFIHTGTWKCYKDLIFRINFQAFWFQLVFTQKALQQLARTF